LLPQVKQILAAAQEIKTSIEKKVNQWRDVQHNLGEVDEAVVRGQVDFMATQLEDKLGEITELGALPKDLDSGLVDFPARLDGKEIYLCWKFGEGKIEYWHSLTEGFGGRKKIQE
jgi:hypothetical protein